MFIGNQNAYKELLRWLQTDLAGRKLTYESFCVVAGASGIGKTIGIESAVKEVGKYLVKIDCNNCMNNKDFKDLITKAISFDLIAQLEEGDSAERIILIDELDALVALDRTFINTLCNLIETNTLGNIKVVITYNLADLKSLAKFYIINLYRPSDADILLYLRHQYPDISCAEILEVVETCQGNISSAIMKIDAHFTAAAMDNAPEIINLFNNLSRDKLFYLFDQDAWLHPLRFHENIIHEFNSRRGVQKNKQLRYIEILKGLCEWDVMMQHYKKYSSDVSLPLEHVCNLVQIVYKFPLKKTNASSPPLHIDNFTKMFNYLSLKKKNIIVLHDGEFPWQYIGNIHKIPFDEKNKKKSKKFSI